MRRECPVCRQTVKGLIKIFLNLDSSLSQRQAAPQTPRRPAVEPVRSVPSSPPVLGTPRRVNPPRLARADAAVVNLASDDSTYEENEGQRLDLSDDNSTTIGDDDRIDMEEDDEYPGLERMEYSDIEPDLNHIDELQDQLARAMLEIRALIDSNDALRRNANAAAAIHRDLQEQARKALAKAESQIQAHQKTKHKLSLAEAQIVHLNTGLAASKAEIDSLMMRKIASDIERILADLTVEQAVTFGSDISGLSTEQICLRMASLVRVSKEDRAQLLDAEKKARGRVLECEQLARKLKKAEEELASLREDKRILTEALDENTQRTAHANAAPPKPKLDPFLRDPFRPAPPQTVTIKPNLSSISAPQKFKTSVKRSFEVPDGTGGSAKKSSFSHYK